MSYHILAYGSNTLPNIERQTQTFMLADLWGYPWVLVVSDVDINAMMAKAIVQFRETEWMQ